MGGDPLIGELLRGREDLRQHRPGADEVHDRGRSLRQLGVVVEGVSDGVGGVCDEAAPVRQSATSAEPLRRSKRLVEMDMTTPNP